MKNKKKIIFGVIILFLIIGLYFLGKTFNNKQSSKTEIISARFANNQILADGDVRSQNEAVLHFQTGGKIVYLPFKEGDVVSQGDIIAQLDTYTLQRQLTSALNNYKSTRGSFDQAQQNVQDGVYQGSQKFGLETQNRSGIGSGDSENNILNDMAKRIIDQNQANLDNSVVNVEIANYALSLASLTSPINGIITHEDVTVPNVNVTPTASFVVSDPDSMVFTVNVPEADIYFVKAGAKAGIKLTGMGDKPLSGTVNRIYPEKIKLANGKVAYKVDIKSPDLGLNSKFGQTGIALIDNNSKKNLILIPNWTILSDEYVWVMENNKPILKEIKTGITIGDYTEIIKGLNAGEKVILDPQAIVYKLYQYE